MIWSVLLTAAIVFAVLNPFGLRDRAMASARRALGRAANLILGTAFLVVILIMLILSIPHFR